MATVNPKSRLYKNKTMNKPSPRDGEGFLRVIIVLLVIAIISLSIYGIKLFI